MDLRQQNIIKYSREILDYLLLFKDKNPDFTFSLRQRDFAKADSEKRLEIGQWFQGSNYIYIPLFKKGDNARKVKTIGFVIGFDNEGSVTKNSIEISFKSGITDEKEIDFHRELAKSLEIQLNPNNHGEKLFDNQNDIYTNLNFFITKFRSEALELIEQFDISKKYIISEEDFQKSLKRIKDINKKNSIDYWVFQGSPKIYNMVDALKENAIKTWTVSAHKDKIKEGDKFILWKTGNNSGCYALGTVTSNVKLMKEVDSEMGYYLSPTEQTESYRVAVKIDHNFYDNPINWETINNDEVFKDFNGGNQGTNFIATKDQYDSILDLINSSKVGVYESIKKELDVIKLNSFLSILKKFIQSENLKINDERLSFNVRKGNNRLVFLIGNRYVLNIEKKNSNTEISFISKKSMNETVGNFTNKKGEIEAYWNKVENIENYESIILESFQIELERQNKCPYRKYLNQDFILDIFNEDSNTIKFIVSNITWNSKDWKEETKDNSNHAWVGGENIPHESWNFDFNNRRNTENNILGFAKFTNSPKIEGNNNLILFYSKGKIVGFYGKAEILKETINLNEKESYNLIGKKDFCIVLNNKIDNIKEKGFLENKERVGQVGFSYLNKVENVLNIIDEAINLNPDQIEVLLNLKKWILENPTYSDLKNIKIGTKSTTMVLNQILYGPPGTGKTYNSINKAIAIINPAFDLNQDRKIVKEEFDRLVGLGQIVFTTFHQSMSYEDFVEGIKPKVEEDANENKQVVYEIEDGIFKRLANKAKLTNTSINSNSTQYSFDDAWDDLITEAEQNIENGTPETLKIQTPNLGLKIVEITERGNLKLKPIYSEDAKEYTVSYSRVKRLHEAFPDLSTVKNIDKEFRTVIGGSNSTAYWSILNILNPKIVANSNNINIVQESPSTPFVLIIDEINRGNISSIFGELITLIEDSKRLGQIEELEVLLPYSKTKFGVPSNLYIIGTMNTADRSVEALDTALRRRFSFEEMPPFYDLKELENEVFGYQLKDIIKTINKRIVRLLNNDHAIGHSYFLNKNEETLMESFYKNIIPLLQEYFFGDYGKMRLVLGDGFIQFDEWNEDDNFFASVTDSKTDYDIKDFYSIIEYKQDNKVGFSGALSKLMNR